MFVSADIETIYTLLLKREQVFLKVFSQLQIYSLTHTRVWPMVCTFLPVKKPLKIYLFNTGTGYMQNYLYIVICVYFCFGLMFVLQFCTIYLKWNGYSWFITIEIHSTLVSEEKKFWPLHSQRTLLCTLIVNVRLLIRNISRQ